MPNIKLVGSDTFNSLNPALSKRTFKKGEVWPVTEAERDILLAETNPANHEPMFEETTEQVGVTGMTIKRADQAAPSGRRASAVSGEIDTAESEVRANRFVGNGPSGTADTGILANPDDPNDATTLDESGNRITHEPDGSAYKGPTGTANAGPNDITTADVKAGTDAPKPKVTLKVGGKAAATPPAPQAGTAEEV